MLFNLASIIAIASSLLLISAAPTGKGDDHHHNATNALHHNGTRNTHPHFNATALQPHNGTHNATRAHDHDKRATETKLKADKKKTTGVKDAHKHVKAT